MTTTTLPVLFLLDCLYGNARGGSETQFLRLYLNAEKVGIDPHVIFLRHQPIHDSIQWRRPPITLNVDSMMSLRAVRAIGEILRYLKKNDIRILQSLFDDSGILTALVKTLKPELRYVCSQRNLGHNRSRIRRYIFRGIYHGADTVLVNSNGIGKLLLDKYGVSPSKIVLIDNMHDIGMVKERVANAPNLKVKQRQESLVGVVVANLRTIKGYDDLIEACALLPESSKIEIVAIGDGAERASFEKAAIAKNVSNRIRFLGYRSDVYEILANCDFGVLPSRAEGGSNSLIEYMLSGIPAIATSVGGNIDFLDNGRFGLLVNPRDPRELSKAFLDLENNINSWRRVADNARIYAEHRFSEHTILKSLRDFYTKCEKKQ